MKVCKERQAALDMTLGKMIGDAKEGAELAAQCGDIGAMVNFANELNTLEEIASRYVAMYKEDPDLIDA